MRLDLWEKHRSSVRTLDLMFFSGRGPFSAAIQWWTQSVETHVGVLMWLKQITVERVFLLHATAKKGVGLTTVSRYLNDFDGQAWWVPLDHEKAYEKNPEYEHSLKEKLFLDLGRKYDFRGIWNFVLPFIKQKKADFICSELTATRYKDAGLYDKSFVSPGEFRKNELLLPGAQLHK